MCLISGRLPSLHLFKAIKLPPAKYLDTEGGTLPAASKFTTSLREELIGVGEGMDTTSNRC